MDNRNTVSMEGSRPCVDNVAHTRMTIQGGLEFQHKQLEALRNQLVGLRENLDSVMAPMDTPLPKSLSPLTNEKQPVYNVNSVVCNTINNNNEMIGEIIQLCVETKRQLTIH